mgnify:CR=1 FL=1
MSVVVGTAGHIDHGKTTLLRALTGIDADRLPEERRRGMTIDVGYAHLALPDGSTLDFVDVPGHDRLVANMLVGAGEIDAVLLVVAADDGPNAGPASVFVRRGRKTNENQVWPCEPARADAACLGNDGGRTGRQYHATHRGP